MKCEEELRRRKTQILVGGMRLIPAEHLHKLALDVYTLNIFLGIEADRPSFTFLNRLGKSFTMLVFLFPERC